MSQADPTETVLDALAALQTEGEAAFVQAGDAEAIEAARIEFLGQKQGRLKTAQERLKTLDASAKRAYGQRFNAAKQAIEAAFEAAKLRVERPLEALEAIDVTLPGHRPRLGHRHPLTQTADELIDLFGRFGFSGREGAGGRGRPAQLRSVEHPGVASGSRPGGQLLSDRRHLAPEPDEHGAGPDHGESAAAGPGDRDRPGLSAGRAGRDALPDVPPDRRSDGGQGGDDGGFEDGPSPVRAELSGQGCEDPVPTRRSSRSPNRASRSICSGMAATAGLKWEARGWSIPTSSAPWAMTRRGQRLRLRPGDRAALHEAARDQGHPLALPRTTPGSSSQF